VQGDGISRLRRLQRYGVEGGGYYCRFEPELASDNLQCDPGYGTRGELCRADRRLSGPTNDKVYAYAGVQAVCLEGSVTWSYVDGFQNSKIGGGGTVAWNAATTGDQISMSVNYLGGIANFTVIEHTQNLRISDVTRLRGLKQNSASCLVTNGQNSAR
jgi:hypothetical protein